MLPWPSILQCLTRRLAYSGGTATQWTVFVCDSDARRLTFPRLRTRRKMQDAGIITGFQQSRSPKIGLPSRFIASALWATSLRVSRRPCAKCRGAGMHRGTGADSSPQSCSRVRAALEADRPLTPFGTLRHPSFFQLWSSSSITRGRVSAASAFAMK